MAMRLPFPFTAMRVIRLIPAFEKSATSSHLPPANGTTANNFESFAINNFPFGTPPYAAVQIDIRDTPVTSVGPDK